MKIRYKQFSFFYGQYNNKLAHRGKYTKMTDRCNNIILLRKLKKTCHSNNQKMLIRNNVIIFKDTMHSISLK